jgi:hypothetical protein
MLHLAFAIVSHCRLQCPSPVGNGGAIIRPMFNMPRRVIFGIFGGLAWFVAGILVGHFVWS